MKRKKHTSKYEHYMADSFARSASKAKSTGDLSRAVTLYEHALNFETEAINLYCLEHGTMPYLVEHYRNAVTYALECGRVNKARHLLETALGSELPADR